MMKTAGQPKRPRSSLRLKLFALAACAMLALTGVLTFLQDRLVLQVLDQQLTASAAAVKPTLVAALSAAMIERDYATIREVMQESVAAGSFTHMVLTDARGQVIATEGWSVAVDGPLQPGLVRMLDGEERMVFAVPITITGQQLGNVYFGLSRRPLQAAHEQLLIGALVAGIAALALLVPVVEIGNRLLFRPLRRLETAAITLRGGNYDIALQPQGDDEVARLTIAFRDMAEAMRDRLHALESSEAAQRGLLTELEMLNASMPAVLMRFRRCPDGMWDTCYTAPSAEAVFGFPLAAARRPGWLQSRLSGDDLARFHEQTDYALAQGTGQTEIGFEHADGSARRLSGTMRRIQTPSGHEDVIIVWIDVTRERAFAAQLAEVAKLASLGEVATGMAHELNQPLATISMAAENLTRAFSRLPDMSPRLVQKLSLITDQAHRASAIIDHMRVFGRAGSTAPEALHLSPLLNAIEDPTRAKLRGSAAQLLLDVPEDLPPFMAGPLALEQVLVNLIGNACDAYLAAGDAIATHERVIRIGAACAAGQVCITVSDHAGGISEDAMPRIFEPFFTTKGVGNGMGLGLSISYGLVTEMGGSIAAENLDGGARFTIRLATAASEPFREKPSVPV